MKEVKGITKVAKNLGGLISKNSPTILTGLAVGGLFTTVIFAVKATPKAVLLIDEELMRRRDEQEGVYHPEVTLTNAEIIKLTWRLYIPAACVGAATIACIVGSNSINQRRNAALASVYSLTEVAFREYKEKVVETIGKNKELKVRDEISHDHVIQNPPNSNEIIFTGKGEVLCCDSLSGRYFKSDIEQIRRAVNEVNRDFLTDMWVSLNDFYYALGLTNTKLGDLMGWNLEAGLIEVSFSSQLTADNEPCLVLNYDIAPKYIY